MRPSKHAAIDLSQAHDLTSGLIERLQCPPEKPQAFLRDRKAPTLRVRVTAAGAKAFVFEAKLARQTIRRTIGDVRSWSIDKARVEANRLRVLVDTGADPRELERQESQAREIKAAKQAAAARTVAEVWAQYIEARRSRWGELHYRDHISMARSGGAAAKRGTRGRGKTIGGPLLPLMSHRLADLTPAVLSAWAEQETKSRPTVTRLAWRLLRGFLSWCSEQPDYAPVLPPLNPAKAKAVREVLSKPKAKQDVLQREQLSAWFGAVRQLPNVTAAAYLQVLLLIGARPGELLALKWSDINWKWKGLTLRDKVEGEREIPLTPHVAHLLRALPRRNDWVFASPSRDPKLSDKVMSTPQKLQDRACMVAGIEGLTLHGLRRSFKSLTEWLEIPTGVVAQIMGHKPSATAERHYTVRSLDLLRLHHEKIEAWVLNEAGIDLPSSSAERQTLRVVK